jgi:hypothetical protein
MGKDRHRLDIDHAVGLDGAANAEKGTSGHVLRGAHGNAGEDVVARRCPLACAYVAGVWVGRIWVGDETVECLAAGCADDLDDELDRLVRCCVTCLPGPVSDDTRRSCRLGVCGLSGRAVRGDVAGLRMYRLRTGRRRIRVSRRSRQRPGAELRVCGIAESGSPAWNGRYPRAGVSRTGVCPGGPGASSGSYRH